MTPGELRTLADGYRLKAERYRGLADALYEASDLREQLARLRELALILDVGDTRGLLEMQDKIREGEL